MHSLPRGEWPSATKSDDDHALELALLRRMAEPLREGEAMTEALQEGEATAEETAGADAVVNAGRSLGGTYFWICTFSLGYTRRR